MIVVDQVKDHAPAGGLPVSVDLNGPRSREPAQSLRSANGGMQSLEELVRSPPDRLHLRCLFELPGQERGLTGLFGRRAGSLPILPADRHGQHLAAALDVASQGRPLHGLQVGRLDSDRPIAFQSGPSEHLIGYDVEQDMVADQGTPSRFHVFQGRGIAGIQASTRKDQADLGLAIGGPIEGIVFLEELEPAEDNAAVVLVLPGGVDGVGGVAECGSLGHRIPGSIVIVLVDDIGEVAGQRTDQLAVKDRVAGILAFQLGVLGRAPVAVPDQAFALPHRSRGKPQRSSAEA